MNINLASIVICTFNRQDLLKECLASLAASPDQACRFEIMVVDNRSTDETPALVDSFRQLLPTLRYVREEQQGLSHARNRGLCEATSEWVAYLDDDARVLEGYFERLGALVEDAVFDCVGGVYVPWYRDGRQNWYLDRYASNAGLFFVYSRLPDRTFVSGGVCLFRRSALLEVGGFDSSLGMSGGRIAYGEETLVQMRLRNRGYRIGFDPDWRIEHYTPPAKQTMRWILQSAYARGRDSWQAFDERPCLRTMVTLLRKMVTRPLLQLGRSCSDPGAWRSWRNPALAVLEPLALTGGQLAEGLRTRRGNA